LRSFPGLPSNKRCPLATKEEVEERLNELIDRLGQNDEAAREIGRSLPDPRILVLHITDLDVWFSTELAEGKLSSLSEGQPDNAHIRIRADSDDLVGLIEGGGNLLSAITSGRVRIKASFSDLLALRRLG
jgi:predicted lipid carrier protein YhbT